MKSIVTITLFWGDGGKGKSLDCYNIYDAKRELKERAKTDDDARLYYSKDIITDHEYRLFYYCYTVKNGKIIKEDINFNN